MTTHIERLRSMMAAWSAGDIDSVIEHLHPDVVWHYAAATHPPVRGTEQCRKMMLRLQPEMSDVEWRVFGHAESGHLLFLEGVDSYTAANGARIATPYAGVIEFEGDLIIGWRDYVDLGVAASQRGGDPYSAQVDELLARPTADSGRPVPRTAPEPMRPGGRRMDMTEIHPPTRRSPWRVVAGLCAVIAIGGCGSSDSTEGAASTASTLADQPEESIVSLPGASTPVVQIRTQAMYPVTPLFLPIEWTTVASDGTVLVPFRGNFAVQPQVWPFEIGHVDVGRVEDLLAAAAAAGLLEEPAGISANPSVVDAPRTTVIITTADGSATHVADALGSGETDAYRSALLTFTAAVTTLVMDATAQPDDGSDWPAFYEPDALDIVAVEVTEDAPGQGTPRIVAWTIDAVDLAAASSCTTVTDDDAIAFLVGQMAGPMFRQDDRLFRVASQIHPPGTACTG